MSMEQLEQIRERLETIAAELGLELVELSGVRLGGHTVIRAFIHKPGGVTIDDCTAVSRAYSDYLDLEDPIAGKYRLEVSSLGLDRPLKEPADFGRRVGEEIKLELKPGDNSKKSVTGKLVTTDEKGITVEIDGERHNFNYDRIVRGKIVY
jgi:ribosome maturation factor RimP